MVGAIKCRTLDEAHIWPIGNYGGISEYVCQLLLNESDPVAALYSYAGFRVSFSIQRQSVSLFFVFFYVVCEYSLSSIVILKA